MAKREIAEFVPPKSGLYPGFLRELTDKEITPKSGPQAGQLVTVSNWDWTFFGSYDGVSDEGIFTYSDITSNTVSKGSRFGARYMAIRGLKALPEDGIDDEEIMAIPVWLTIKPDGKISDDIAIMSDKQVENQPPAFHDALNSMYDEQGNLLPSESQDAEGKGDKVLTEQEQDEIGDDIPF